MNISLKISQNKGRAILAEMYLPKDPKVLRSHLMAPEKQEVTCNSNLSTEPGYKKEQDLDSPSLCDLGQISEFSHLPTLQT